MKRFLIACVMVGALAGSAATLLAHHSFAAEFDDKQPLKLTGTLTKVEWNNPHIWYYLDVKNPDGTTTTWGLSGGAPGQLMRRGIRKDQLVVGSGRQRRGLPGEGRIAQRLRQQGDVRRWPQRLHRDAAGSAVVNAPAK